MFYHELMAMEEMEKVQRQPPAQPAFLVCTVPLEPIRDLLLLLLSTLQDGGETSQDYTSRLLTIYRRACKQEEDEQKLTSQQAVRKFELFSYVTAQLLEHCEILHISSALQIGHQQPPPRWFAAHET